MLNPPEALHRDFPYLNNVRADIRLLGFPACLNATTAWSSAGRLGMFASMITQTLIVDGCELNHLFSGTEMDYGKYAFDFSSRTQDVEILDVFPKYRAINTSANKEAKNPQTMVIYRGKEDGQIGYFTVDRYFYMSDGFGCENKFSRNINAFLKKGMILPKDEKLVFQPNQKGNRYCYGLNCNTAFMTLSQTNEDAMVISESLAKRLESLEMRRVIINIRQDYRPLNLYGDDTVTKIIPDIGERVRDDGILFAARRISTTTYAADTDPVALRESQPLCDTLVTVPKNATVADIEIYSSKRGTATMYHQVVKYQDGLREYHERIYNSYVTLGRPKNISPAYSTLVANSINHLIAAGRDPGNFVRRGQRTKLEIEGMDNHPIECIQMVVTLKVKRKVTLGMKLSGVDGSKGVVAEIRKDEDMPIDAHGIRADLIIDPASPIKRMNTGQLYECHINRISEFVRRRIAEEAKVSMDLAFQTLTDWYSKVNANYGQLVRELRNTPAGRAALVTEAINDFPKIHMPPFLDGITPAVVKAWSDEYGAGPTPVTFTVFDGPNKTLPRRVLSKYPVNIGPKYLMLLCKIPKATSSGPSHVSHKGNPIKPGREAKYSTPLSVTPVRQGEDEGRVELIAVPGRDVVRLTQLMSNSPKGFEVVMDTHLTHPTPLNIDQMPVTDEWLYDHNAIHGTFFHQVATLGIDLKNTQTNLVPPDDLEFLGDVLGGVSYSDLGGDDDSDGTETTPKTRKPRMIKVSAAMVRGKPTHVLMKNGSSEDNEEEETPTTDTDDSDDSDPEVTTPDSENDE